MKMKVIVAAAAAVALAVAAVVVSKTFFREGGEVAEGRPEQAGKAKATVPTPEKKSAKAERGEKPRRPVVTAATKAALKKKIKKLRGPVEDQYTPSERRLADTLQDASDDNDLGKMREAVKGILAQKNAELKMEAVSALGFFGKDSLTDLMAFLRDSNQEVVESAASAISSALDELDEEENGFRAEFISTLLSVDGLCKRDTADIFVGQLECIGSSDEKLAVQTMVNLLEDGKVGKSVKTRLKEAYKFVTGEKYTTFEAADKWYRQKTAEEQEEAAGADESDDDDKKSDDDDKKSDDNAKDAES